MTTSEVQTLIEGSLPGAKALVKDRRGSGDHFEAVVIASQFEDRSLVEQHRLAYGTGRQHLEVAGHALELQTFNPFHREQAEIEGGQVWIWQPK